MKEGLEGSDKQFKRKGRNIIPADTIKVGPPQPERRPIVTMKVDTVAAPTEAAPPRDTNEVSPAAKAISTEIMEKLDYPRAKLSDKYKELLAGRKPELGKEDLAFFEGLLTTYGVSIEDYATDGKKTLEKDEFFSACADIETYGMQLRGRLMPNWEEEKDILQEELKNRPRPEVAEDQDMDTLHPAQERLKDLSTLFLHHPSVKPAYMQVQTEKMVGAFPTVITGLESLKTNQTIGENEYFLMTQFLMNAGMTKAAKKVAPEKVSALGFVIGYQEDGMVLSEEKRKDKFATIGTSDFLLLLKKVTDETIKEGGDLQAAVRREFLKRDGVGFSSMRLHIREFSKHVRPKTKDKKLDAARDVFKGSKFTIGACPAIGKMESLDEPGNQRPIVYEYASAIIRNMPPHLLQPDAHQESN